MSGAANKAARGNGCLSCPGFCCSQNLINVCGYDAWLVATGLSVEPASFLAFAQMGTDSPYHFRLDSSGEAYCLALNMRERPDGSRRCHFLMELPNGQTRCGIYGLRPVACRAYPLALTEDGVAVKPWAMCPAQRPTLSQQEVISWQAELERHDLEFSIYALVVETWNRKMIEQPGIRELDFRPFLAFLMEAYGRLEQARRAVPEKSWPSIWSRWRRFTAEGLNPISLPSEDRRGNENWRHWLHEIRRAVADSAEGIGGNSVAPSRRRKETVV